MPRERGGPVPVAASASRSTYPRAEPPGPPRPGTSRCLSLPQGGHASVPMSLLLAGGQVGYRGGDVGFHGCLAEAEAGQYAVTVFEQREQDVLGPDVVVAQPQGLPEGEFQ